MQRLPSGLPDLVADDEDLARFLTSASQFNAKGAKPSGYLPNPKYRNASVFRQSAEPVADLLQIWQDNAAPERTLHAVALCKAVHVRAAKLDVIAEEPPPKHANIEGWPWNDADPEMAKAAQKELAALIAQKAEVVHP
jgi:hypothetical protein